MANLVLTEELLNKLDGAESLDVVKGILQAEGIEASDKEIMKALFGAEDTEADEEKLTDEKLDKVSGGFWPFRLH